MCVCVCVYVCMYIYIHIYIYIYIYRHPVDGRLLLQDGPDLLLAWVGKYDPETRAAVKAATQLATVLFFFAFLSRARCHTARHGTLRDGALFFSPPDFLLKV